MHASAQENLSPAHAEMAMQLMSQLVSALKLRYNESQWKSEAISGSLRQMVHAALMTLILLA
jgi:hypothetical protein